MTIFVTEKNVKLYSSGRNQSFSVSSVDESPITRATGCMVRNSPCLILGQEGLNSAFLKIKNFEKLLKILLDF